MRKISLLRVTIIILILIMQRHVSAPVPKPQGATLGCLIVTVVVGGIVLYSFYVICDRALPDTPKTNAPPQTNTTSNVEYPIAISNYSGNFTAEIQTGANLVSWETAGRIRLEFANGAATMVTESPNGIPLLTNQAAIAIVEYAGQSFWSVTNDVSSVIQSRGEPIKLWRVR